MAAKRSRQPNLEEASCEARISISDGLGDWLATGKTDRKILLRRPYRRDLTRVERAALDVAMAHVAAGEVSIIVRRSESGITYIAERIPE